MFPSQSKQIYPTNSALTLGIFMVVSMIVFNACFLFQQQGSPIPFNQSYAVLQRNLDGGYYLTTAKILKFKYSEEYNVSAANDKLNYIVYDRIRTTKLGVDDNNMPIITGTPLKAVQYGDNRFDIDLTGLGLVSGNFYILEVVNDKNEKRYLRFKLD